MPDAMKLKDKLSLYLSTLSDSAQQLLLRSLENGEKNGSNDHAADLILLALRSVMKEEEPDIPFEPFAREEFSVPANLC